MTSPANFSETKPPMVYRPVKEDAAVANIRTRIGEMVDVGIVKRRPGQYRLDTLYTRETREISHLGELAVAKFTEALALLGPKMTESWEEEIVVPVTDVVASSRMAGGARLILKVAQTEELKAERELAVEVLKRMSGRFIPPLNFTRNITVGRLNVVVDKLVIEASIHDVAPSMVTLLPNRIDLK